MRIIAGSLKGRILKFDSKRIRPTTGKTREKIFSILTSGQFLHEEGSVLTDAEVLDLCCGIGSLGFEAISRGAKRCTFVDIDGDPLELIKRHAHQFDVSDQVITLRADATCLPVARKTFDIVFIDPPYHLKITQKIMKELVTKGWLSPEALVIVEHSKKEDIPKVDFLKHIDLRKHSRTEICLYQHEG